jgi:TM2 domain-containing membrane protein YozV
VQGASIGDAMNAPVQPPSPYAQPQAGYSHQPPQSGYGQSHATVPVPYGAGESQVAAYQAQPPVRVISPKSAGIAVLLTFLWLGAGHLYANRVTTGVILIISDMLLWALSFTIILAIVTVPIYIILLVVSAILAAQAAKDFNYRNGVALR